MGNLLDFSTFIENLPIVESATIGEFWKDVGGPIGIRYAKAQKLAKYVSWHKRRRDDVYRQAKAELDRRYQEKESKHRLAKIPIKIKPAQVEGRESTISKDDGGESSVFADRLNPSVEEVAKDIINSIPKKLLEDPEITFYDPFMADGQFVRQLQEKLKSMDPPRSDEEITSRIYGTEADQATVDIATGDLGTKIYPDRKKTLGNFAVLRYNEVLKKLPEGWPKNMKFDVILGNPPFSKANPGKTAGKHSVSLYDKFFELAVNNANFVGMILPRTRTKLDRKHNDLLNKHANQIVDVDPAYFPNIAMETCYVIANKNNPIKIKGQGSLFKPRNSISWVRGKVQFADHKTPSGEFGDAKPKSQSDITIYHKLNSREGLVTRYVRKSTISPKKLFPSSGYALLFPLSLGDGGWSKTEIVKCTGSEAASPMTYVVFFKTKQEAAKLDEYMKTPKFVEAAKKKKAGKNTMILPALRSIPMPGYEK